MPCASWLSVLSVPSRRAKTSARTPRAPASRAPSESSGGAELSPNRRSNAAAASVRELVGAGVAGLRPDAEDDEAVERRAVLELDRHARVLGALPLHGPLQAVIDQRAVRALRRGSGPERERELDRVGSLLLRDADTAAVPERDPAVGQRSRPHGTFPGSRPGLPCRPGRRAGPDDPG